MRTYIPLNLNHWRETLEEAGLAIVDDPRKAKLIVTSYSDDQEYPFVTQLRAVFSAADISRLDESAFFVPRRSVQPIGSSNFLVLGGFEETESIIPELIVHDQLGTCGAKIESVIYCSVLLSEIQRAFQLSDTAKLIKYVIRDKVSSVTAEIPKLSKKELNRIRRAMHYFMDWGTDVMSVDDYLLIVESVDIPEWTYFFQEIGILQLDEEEESINLTPDGLANFANLLTTWGELYDIMKRDET